MGGEPKERAFVLLVKRAGKDNSLPVFSFFATLPVHAKAKFFS
jgi:hypothetical protein